MSRGCLINLAVMVSASCASITSFPAANILGDEGADRKHMRNHRLRTALLDDFPYA
jgi:hypothetical protein